MRWQCQWAEHLEFLQADAEEHPDDPPPALEDRPDLEDGLEFYHEAFWMLNLGRQMGMGPGGITMVDLEAACRLLHVEHCPRFVRYLRACDAEYLAFQVEQVKARE